MPPTLGSIFSFCESDPMFLSKLIDLIRAGRIWIFLALAAGMIFMMRGCWRASSIESSIVDMVWRNQYDSAWELQRASHAELEDCQRHRLTLFVGRFDIRTDTSIFRALDSLTPCRYAPDSAMEFAARGHLRIASRARIDTSDRWKLYASAFRAASECVKSDSTHVSCWYLGFDALMGMRDTFSTRAWARMARTRWPDDTSFRNLEGIALALGGKTDSALMILAKSCPDSLANPEIVDACRRAVEIRKKIQVPASP